jgi:hypothetical protein
MVTKIWGGGDMRSWRYEELEILAIRSTPDSENLFVLQKVQTYSAVSQPHIQRILRSFFGDKAAGGWCSTLTFICCLNGIQREKITRLLLLFHCSWAAASANSTVYAAAEQQQVPTAQCTQQLSSGKCQQHIVGSSPLNVMADRPCLFTTHLVT